MQTIRILKENAQEERGDIARMSSFVGATALGDLIKTTLGPKGMVRINCIFYPGSRLISI